MMEEAESGSMCAAADRLRRDLPGMSKYPVMVAVGVLARGASMAPSGRWMTACRG
jgi:hypothetical protein